MARNSVADGIDRLSRGLRPWARWAPAFLLVGALPGLIAWQLTHLDQVASLATNTAPSRSSALLHVAISAAVSFASLLVVHGRRARTAGTSLEELAGTVSRYGAALAVVPVYFFLRSDSVGHDHPFFTLAACIGAGALVARVAYGSRGMTHLLAPRDTENRLLPLLAVLTVAALFAADVVHLALVHHRNLGTRDWDFGIYINTVWHSLHGDLLGCTLLEQGTHAYRHFDPILILISPILLIHNGAQSLTVFQVAWFATGAVPAYLIGRARMRNALFGFVLAAVYLLHPAFHGALLYGFHSMTLAGPLLLWSVFFLEADRWKSFFVSITLLMLCREDMPILAFLIGLFALWRGKPRRIGVATLALAALYGGAVYLAVVANAATYAHRFEEIRGANGSVIWGILSSSLTNPVFVLKYVFAEKKILYVLELVGPLLLLPLFSGKYRVLFLCGLAVTMFGSSSCFLDISMQYSVWWLPFLIASVPEGIARFPTGRLGAFLGIEPSRFRAAATAGLLTVALLASAAFGVLWPNPDFRAGYEKFKRYPSEKRSARIETIEKVAEMIPDDASVMATGHLVPHFAAREWIWSLDKPGYRASPPDYAVLWKADVKRKKNRESNDVLQKQNLKALRDSKKYERLLKENGITLYKRR